MTFRRFLSPCLAAVLIGGCGKGNFNGHVVADKNALTYSLDNPVTTLDPGKVQDIDMEDVLKNVFEGLVSYDENNRISKQLAESWKIENGGRTYVFTLRKDAKFSNGRLVTAEDFAWSWKRNLGAALQSPISRDYLKPIVGVDAYADGKASDIQGVKVVDARTLSVTIDKPRPYFLGMLTYPCTYVIAKEAAGPGEMKSGAEAIGTGPFKFSRTVADQELDLEANPNYYLGAPSIAAIHRPVIKDPSTRLNKYKTGELDQLSLNREDLKSVEADPVLGKQIAFQPIPALYYFHLNEHAYPPFKDVRVRRAFEMALDRRHLVTDLLTGYVEAEGILPPGFEGYREDLRGPSYDPAGAKKLLAEAGFGENAPPVTIVYRDGAADARIAATVAAESLTQNLGIKATPRAMEWGTLLSERAKGKLQMIFSSWYADYLDPQNFLSMLLTSTAPQNTEGWSNKDFDALCAKADIEPDEATRIKLYQQAEDIAVDEVAKLPLYFQRNAVLTNSRVSGMRRNLFGDLPALRVKLR